MKTLYYALLLILIPTNIIGQNILHYDETTGYDHQTRDASMTLFQTIAANNGYTVTQDSDGSQFTIASLMTFDLVVFSNTSGNSGLNASQQDALEWFIDVKGGSLLGIHAATDTYRHSTANGGSKGSWDWYAETIGGSVQQGPNHTSSNHVNNINSTTSDPILNNSMVFPWEKEEEYYYWENGYLNPSMVEVLEVGETGGNSYDAARPVAWKRELASGAKIFYTSLGHKTQNFTGSTFPQFKLLVENAVIWSLSTVLPVTLDHFEAIYLEEEKKVELRWETKSEIDNDYFEILKSKDQRSWSKIGLINASGNAKITNEYSMYDRDPTSGISYYRLLQYDVDGTKSFLAEKSVKIKTRPEIELTPNLASDFITLFTSDIRTPLNFSVFDQSGRLVHKASSRDQEAIKIDIQSWESGVYFISIRMKDIQETLKFVKI